MKKHLKFLKGSFLIIPLAFFLSCSLPGGRKAVRLTAGFHQTPVGIENPHPLLGWNIEGGKPGIRQTAYRIVAAHSPGELKNDKKRIWDSGKVTSGESVNIPYGGKALQPGERCYWKVKFWDQNDEESGWSTPSWWQMAIVPGTSPGNARWISLELPDSSDLLVPGIHGSGNHLGDKLLKRPVVPLFRKNFHTTGKPVSATLSISGLGHYIASVNGKTTGESFLAPGWTDYDKTVFYNSFDVTPMIKAGENVIGVIVGNGFHHINRERYRKLVIGFGMPRMICHLQLAYADGRTEMVVSGEDWKVAPSPVTYTSILGGEDYDARLEQPGWDSPGFDDSGWQNALFSPAPAGVLKAEDDYPLKVMERFDALQVRKLKNGSWIYDFGQNASGIVQLHLKGKPGSAVQLWPSELINPDSTANQRASGQPYYFSYTLKGSPEEMWQPGFTYYGFRYVEVKGAVPAGESNPEGLPEIGKMTFLHTRNSAPENGTFSCSNDLLNRIHNLIDYAIKSNMQSVLTDCPHREKLGWLEQTYLMGNGVHFRYDIGKLYRKQVFDMIDAQTAEGLVPDIAPEYVEFNGGFRDSPEWGSACVVLPYLLWKWYGDTQIIETAWPMMLNYTRYLEKKSTGHILDYGLGDWFDLGPKSPGVSQLTPVSLTASAIYYHDVSLLAEMAVVAGKPEREMLLNWAEEVRSAFNARFFDQEKMVYSTGSQTAMSMPWCFGLIDPPFRQGVFNNLVDSIVAGNKALTAGDVGFHYLIEALTRGGASDLIFDMVNRDDVPGYGYQLRKGATALTESWAALEIVSNNHLMLGHVMEWFYAGLGGIGQSPSSTGYQEIEIRPEVVGDLTFVNTSFRSPYGWIRSDWKRDGDQVTFDIDIPHNTTATLFLPPEFSGLVSVNDKKAGSVKLPENIMNGRVSVSLVSGKNRITALQTQTTDRD